MDTESLEQLRNILGQYPRMHGYYLVNFVPLPPGWRDDEEESLATAFGELDDQEWKPVELRPKDQLWVDCEVQEAEARVHALEALVGGGAVGHSSDTVPKGDALAIWQRFRELFASEARFFMGLGFGDSAYVFQLGVVVLDDEKAGCLCVVESD
jgi:hypothetical protein